MTRGLASGLPARSLALALVAFGLVSGCSTLVGADFDRPALEDGSAPSPFEVEAPVPVGVDSRPHAEDSGPAKDSAVTCPPGACCPGCADGQRCAGGQCVCDVSSCKGCCRNNQCLDGTGTAACGDRGAACETCGASQACNSKCITVKAPCFNFNGSFETSCDDMCQRAVGGGAYCAPALCTALGTPIGGGLVFNGDSCDDPTKGAPQLACGTRIFGSPSKRALCCCALP